MKNIILGSVLILVATSVLAGNDQLSILDANKDGLLSVEEAKVDANLSAAFAELDVNHDGFLSELELTAKIDSRSQNQQNIFYSCAPNTYF